MAAPLIGAMRRVQRRGAYALCGFSFGGTVAFELAQQLLAVGDEIAFLGVGDIGASRDHPASLGDKARATAGACRNTLWWIADDLLRTPPRALLQRARQRGRSFLRKLAAPNDGPGRFAAKPADFWDMDRLPDTTRRVIEMRFAAVGRYVPKRYRGNLTLFRARAQPLLKPGVGRDLGWRALCDGNVTVEMIPGSHDTILHGAGARRWAERLAARLGAS